MLPKLNYEAGSLYHRQRRHLQTSTVRCVETAVSLFGRPASVLDVGCGAAAPLVDWCEGKGIFATGVDLAVLDGRDVLQHDLRLPLDLDRVFQWVLCWEVAEHLPPESADTLCDTLARHIARPQGRLIFTAAVPGQSGPGHINCQPQTYWRGLLETRGLRWLAGESQLLSDLWLSEVPRAPWYGRNVQVFGWA